MEHHWYDRPGLHRERSVSLAHAAVRRRGADPSLFTRLGAFTASLLCVSCLCLAAASGAQADFVAVGTGACADASPPAGETGGYYWVGSDGTCSPDWISSSDLQSLANQEVAAVVTYIRMSWGNHGTAVSPQQVSDLRSAPLD